MIIYQINASKRKNKLFFNLILIEPILSNQLGALTRKIKFG